MKTSIDERAIEKYPITAENADKAIAMRKLYVQIATEQKAIDDKELESYVAMTAKEVKQVIIDKACEWLRNELPAYLGLFTSHFQEDDDVEQVVVKACVNAQIYDDLKKVMEE